LIVTFLPVDRTNDPTDTNKQKLRRNLFYFRFARQAMRAAIEELTLEKNKIVLMPASVCPAVLEPFINAGIKIRLYSLNHNLKWDINEIRDKICNDTIAVYTIHYFGILYDLTAIRLLCNEKQVKLIEDCALAGYHEGTTIGETGDIAIFSLWKFHPLSGGAILKFNNEVPSFLRVNLETSRLITILIGLLKIRIKSLMSKLSLQPNSWRRELSKRKHMQDPAPIDTRNQPYAIQKMHNLDFSIFCKENLYECAKRRRTNYFTLAETAKNAGIELLYTEVDSNSVPYCLPIVIDDAHRLQRVFLRAGIQTEISINQPYANQPYLCESNESFDDINYLSNQVLGIPVHQNLTVRQITHMKEQLIAWGRKI